MGLLFLAMGLVLAGLTTVLPLWEAQHGRVGSSVAVGIRNPQGVFAAPFFVMLGLALLVGRDRMVGMVERETKHGRSFWMAFFAIGSMLGGAHMWWFHGAMSDLGYRRDPSGIMTKHSSSAAATFSSLPPALQLPPKGAPAARRERASRISQEAREQLSPEAKKLFPSLKPGGETPRK
jgi:hypothetical protein